mmetsp:Transcript_88342/g.254881  ORF Transcript_88342/g.254881 Transcript_88342/m.254881 type:complete len:200 (-) Transcript_88342:259-858(-)
MAPSASARASESSSDSVSRTAASMRTSSACEEAACDSCATSRTKFCTRAPCSLCTCCKLFSDLPTSRSRASCNCDKFAACSDCNAWMRSQALPSQRSRSCISFAVSSCCPSVAMASISLRKASFSWRQARTTLMCFCFMAAHSASAVLLSSCNRRSSSATSSHRSRTSEASVLDSRSTASSPDNSSTCLRNLVSTRCLS